MPAGPTTRPRARSPAPSPARRPRARVRARLALLLALLALLLPGRALADTWGQYLVVLDDSGSMDQNDPRRLVVMAAAAMALALEDGDQIALVGLNELADGAELPRFVGPGELLAGRDGPEAARPLAGPRFDRIAQHRGGTPCRAALDRARALLERAASAGAPQTLLFLTDGACNGGPVERAESWLAGLRAHAEGRFRFVLLTRDSRDRVDPELLRYAQLTGWTGDPRIAFDARALLRAFAEVLSFSRGLRHDDGGRPGQGRTFAGARRVRALAIAEAGTEPIALVRADDPGDAGDAPIVGGPTFTSTAHGWSLRAATLPPRDRPFAVRAGTAGVDVLVIPSYGDLRVEAVVAPCGLRPPLPWSRELAVRAGQPACAFARLVGDAGDTIVPGRSFAFDLELCDDPACASASAMQPDADGTFNAQLGPAPASGRHERAFRARGGALARPVVARRAFAAMAFGIAALTRAGDDAPLAELDLGDLPRATRETLSLAGRGAFPAGATADVTCAIEGDAAIRACLTCAPAAPTIALQDPLALQLDVDAAPFCPAVSDHGGQPVAVRMTLQLAPRGDAAAALPPFTLPIRGLLRYAAVAPQELRVRGGDDAVAVAQVPAPIAAAVALEIDAAGLPGDLRLAPVATATRLQSPAPGGLAPVELRVEAGECCAARAYDAALVLRAESGGPALRVPLRVVVDDPGFWVCPGRKILRWGLAALGLLLLVWVIRGFVSPAKFAPGIVLAYAESHPALAKLREGDEGWLRIDRFPEVRRGFYRPATLHLGGAKAPLPSLRRMSPTTRVEARPGGGLVLIVAGEGNEAFSESKGWHPLDPGEHPVHARMVLRREGTLYLLLRR